MVTLDVISIFIDASNKPFASPHTFSNALAAISIGINIIMNINLNNTFNIWNTKSNPITKNNITSNKPATHVNAPPPNPIHA